MVIDGEEQPLSWILTAEGGDIALPPAEVAAIHRDSIAGLPRANLPIPLAPLTVSLNAFHTLLDASSRLVKLLHRTYLELTVQKNVRMKLLGIADVDCPVFSDDEFFELDHAADMCRADVVIDSAGPKFIEFNVSGTFEGILDFQARFDGWERVMEKAQRPSYIGIDPFPSFASLIRNTCESLNVSPQVVFAGTRRFAGQLPARTYYLRKTAMLRRHGIMAEHLEFEDLLDGIGFPGAIRKPLGIFDFTARDAAAMGYDIDPVWTALRSGFKLIPSQSSWFLHSKKLLAMLSAKPDWMVDAERELVDTYIPWTRIVRAGQVVWHDSIHDLHNLIIVEQHNMVLKTATGDAGTEIYFGSSFTKNEWQGLVAEAMKNSNFVVQERVVPVTCPVDVWTNTDEIISLNSTAVISPFYFGGVSSGCYARLMQLDMPGVVSMKRGAITSCLLGRSV